MSENPEGAPTKIDLAMLLLTSSHIAIGVEKWSTLNEYRIQFHGKLGWDACLAS